MASKLLKASLARRVPAALDTPGGLAERVVVNLTNGDTLDGRLVDHDDDGLVLEHVTYRGRATLGDGSVGLAEGGSGSGEFYVPAYSVLFLQVV